MHGGHDLSLWMRSHLWFAASVQVSVFQVPVFERETLFFPLAPFLVVEINICALLIVFCDSFWFFVPLKPHHVLCVEPPRLLLQSLCCEVLSLGTLHVIEDKEERFRG